MAAFRNRVSMRREPDEKIDFVMPPPLSDIPDYPPGLSICLTEAELEKLGLPDDCNVGDKIEMEVVAVVRSVSKNEVNGESKCRVELQIEEIEIDDEEEEEGEDE